MAIPTQFSATDLETAFLLMDKSFDGRASGKITVEKLRAVYEGFGQECPTDEELERMISVVGSEGGVNFNQFRELIKKPIRIPREEDYRAAYEIFTLNDPEEGITQEKLYRVMHQMGENVSESDVRMMMGKADRDEDGVINWNDFERLIQKDAY